MMRDARSDRGRGELFALAALAFLLLVTALWWALALWPQPDDAPRWLQSAREVCFGAAHDGLPDAGGWILLIGEPLGMAAALFVVWGEQLRGGLRALAAGRGGRVMLGVWCALLVAGVVAALSQVASARAAGVHATDARPTAPARPLDVPAPPLDLVDQHGNALTLARFSGRPVLVAFAYAHCETVCPLLVRDALDAQRLAAERAGEAAPVVVLVTLDPWRDTPSRLPHIAESWALGPDAFIAGGTVAAVEAVLAVWEIETYRDATTGEIVHPSVVFVVDGDGVLRYAAGGGAASIADLVAGLDSTAAHTPGARG